MQCLAQWGVCKVSCFLEWDSDQSLDNKVQLGYLVCLSRLFAFKILHFEHSLGVMYLGVNRHIISAPIYIQEFQSLKFGAIWVIDKLI